ncbi:ABC transporter substrate-binding protein [Natronorubrum halophilum]|uniref:ABC transporter substrate-binding protein n=1 Tax=Natronorubrum halophilum TaxID=1702106 RepID=UPI0010C1E615|nr:ABC transporter substrate-binding protein [Natronorubrum halophilum]
MPNHDTTTSGAPTRRDTIKYGGAVVVGGLLAGCTGEDPSGADDADGDHPDSWTVRMEPRTEVTFESVPESVVVYRADYAGMLIALGHGDALVGMQDTQSLPTEFLEQLPGVSVDPAGITQLRQGGEYDKEVFYEIDADLHLIDPNNAKHYFDFDEDDISDLETAVAPWLGSFIRRPQEEIGPGYPHYTLYEAFEKVSEVFRERERYEAIAEIHEAMLSQVEAERPPADERPSVGLAFLVPGEDFVGSGTFYLNDPTQPGMAMKQYHDLGVEDAWAAAGVDADGSVGYETLLEADPDVIIAHNAFGYTDSEAQFQSEVVDVMRSDSLGSELTAVQNGRVYRGGKNVQGPITNLFQTEVAAKQLYPEAFGEWRGLGETPEEEQLFDREEVADIVSGEE